MAAIKKSASRLGKFTKAADSAPPPVSVDIRKPGDTREGIQKALATVPVPKPFDASAARSWLHQASDTTQRHPVQRPTPTSPGAKQDEGGALTAIQPATTVGQLQRQISLLIDAFVAAEGREPNHDDDGFWAAYRQLVEAYGGIELGSAARATEPLNADGPVRKAVRETLAKAADYQRFKWTCDRCGKSVTHAVARAIDEPRGWKDNLCDDCVANDD